MKWLGSIAVAAALAFGSSAARADMKALEEAAKKEGELTWYVAHYTSEGAEELGAVFTKMYGIKVNVESYDENQLSSKLLTEFASMIKKSEERPQLPVPRLTDRELEVLKLVARGLRNSEIAKELFISENTVKNHVRNILEKLQLHSRMEAVMYAMREKLLDLP